MKSAFLAVATAAVLAIPSAAAARTVTLTYSGTITSVSTDLSTTYNLLNAEFSGTVIIEDIQFGPININLEGSLNRYDVSKFRDLLSNVDIAGAPSLSTTDAGLIIQDSTGVPDPANGSGTDDLIRIDTTPSFDQVGIADFGIFWHDSTGMVFSTSLLDALVGLGPTVDLSQFDADRAPDFLINLQTKNSRGFDGNSVFGNCDVMALGGGCRIEGNITSASVSVSGMAAVPLPASGLLLVGGLMAAGTLRRRINT